MNEQEYARVVRETFERFAATVPPVDDRPLALKAFEIPPVPGGGGGDTVRVARVAFEV